MSIEQLIEDLENLIKKYQKGEKKEVTKTLIDTGKFGKQGFVLIKGSIVMATEKAIQVSQGGKSTEWLPKSQIKNQYSEEPNVEQEFEIPTWLYKKHWGDA